MFISFGQKLKGLGNVRVGGRLKGSDALLVVFLYWMINFCWYMVLGSLWAIYGTCYLCFYLPYKGIVKLCKKLELRRKIEEASHKYSRNPSQTDNTNN